MYHTCNNFLYLEMFLFKLALSVRIHPADDCTEAGEVTFCFLIIRIGLR